MLGLGKELSSKLGMVCRTRSPSVLTGNISGLGKEGALKWDVNAYAGTNQVHLELFYRTQEAQQWDELRHKDWSVIFRAWRTERDRRAARFASFAPRKHGRPAAAAALKAHLVALPKLRWAANAIADGNERSALGSSWQPGVEAWLDGRHEYLAPDALAADREDLAEAALHCGYGLYLPPERFSRLPPSPPSLFLWEDAAFAANWSRRMEYFLSHVDLELRPYPFVAWLESSDKGVLSFALGGVFCYLAAQRWLYLNYQAGIAGMFHYKLVNAALVSGYRNFCVPGTEEFKAEGEAPDYVALDTNGNLHFFEAKGGLEAGRHAALHKGLQQLQAAAQSVTVLEGGPSSGVGKSITTGLAVYTCVDPGQKIRVAAYDPPERNEKKGEHRAGLCLHLGLARCLAIVELRMLFEALPSDQGELRAEDVIWKRRGTKLFGVSASSEFVDSIKAQLATYFAIRGALPTGFISEGPEFAKGEGPAWRSRVLTHTFDAPSLGARDRIRLIEAAHAAKVPSEILPVLADQLGFSTSALAVQLNASSLAGTLSSRGLHVSATGTGLLVTRLRNNEGNGRPVLG